MLIEDEVRETEIEMGTIDIDKEVEIVARNRNRGGGIIWFYMNEEQARDVVRHLNREFDLGLGLK